MKRIRNVLIFTFLFFAFFYIIFSYLPDSQEKWCRSVCRVSVRSYYALPVGNKDILFLSLQENERNEVAVHPDSLKDSVEISGVFVSYNGYVVTTDLLISAVPDTLSGKALQDRLTRLDSVLEKRLQTQQKEWKELNNYAATHTAVDDGYNEVMLYRETVTKSLQQTDSAYQLVKKALTLSQVFARRCSKYHFEKCLVKKVNNESFCSSISGELKECKRADGLLLLQAVKHTFPKWMQFFYIHRFGTFTMGRQLVAYNDLGGQASNDSVSIINKGDEVFPTSEGGAWINLSGQLCGIQRKGKRISSYTIAKLFRSEHIWIVGWWNNTVARFKMIFIDNQNEKEWKRQPNVSLSKCYRLHLADSALYEGQCIYNQRLKRLEREGYGNLLLKDGTIYQGIWKADSLFSGECIDSLGIYDGTFNRNLKFHGMGIYKRYDGETYSGQWKEGIRNGHGFSSQAEKMVRCGVWKNGTFQGERMVYTSDRVYGIDISRYQHGRGRKAIPIVWKNLRITSLGKGRRVQGNVNYPVSFIYVKSTEGKSVRNKFYVSDCKAARSYKIPTGSYHFFSTKSTGLQQASFFLKHSKILKTDLPPVLDLEPTEKQISQMGGDAAMFKQVMIWLQRVERVCGKRPILYVGQQFVNKHLKNAPTSLRSYDVWIARYGEFKPYVRLLHWQLTPYGKVNGITGEVDINVFNGTREQFQTYLQTH